MYTKINEDYKFYYNEEIIEDFSKIPKMNFCDENFSKIIFYFKRNCETYEIFNMQDAYQVKHIGCGNIQNSNYFSKSYKLDYGIIYLYTHFLHFFTFFLFFIFFLYIFI